MPAKSWFKDLRIIYWVDNFNKQIFTSLQTLKLEQWIYNRIYRYILSLWIWSKVKDYFNKPKCVKLLIDVSCSDLDFHLGPRNLSINYRASTHWKGLYFTFQFTPKILCLELPIMGWIFLNISDRFFFQKNQSSLGELVWFDTF